LCLERARDKDIHLHVQEPPASYLSGPYALEFRVVPVLLSHARRIRTLRLQPFSHETGLLKSVFDLWLACGDVQPPKSLFVREAHANGILSLDEPRPGALASYYPENAEQVLLSITTLHLEGAIFSWDSNVYRDLVELKLQCRHSSVSASQLQLAGLFSASPALAVLKIAYLKVTRTEGCLPSIPVLLSRLKLLALNLKPNSLERLLPLILVPDSKDLSVSVPFHKKPQDALEYFFARSKVATLFCYGSGSQYRRPKPSLLRSLTHVSTVVILKDFLIDDKYNTPSSESQLLTSWIPNVIADSCKVTFEGLKALVSEHQINQLRLQCCTFQASIQTKSQSLEDIRTLLLGIYPNLQVSIENMNSTDGHSIRRWDEYD
ncbi:hypothetical protein FRC09_008820, partial [Ceratobasidium sp. 395]